MDCQAALKRRSVHIQTVSIVLLVMPIYGEEEPNNTG
jgi:hypothetical protein